MSKLALIAGLVIPMVLRHRAMKADNDTVATVAIDAPPHGATLATVAATVAAGRSSSVDEPLPWPDLPQMLAPEAAVEALLADLVEYHGEGAQISVAAITSYYLRFGMRRGWPSLTDRAISRLLCGLGCERQPASSQVRDAQGRRLAHITLVPALAVDEDETYVEPMRLVA